ncbi:MAG: hypothetical protein IJR61_01440 [Clostridia bacterium]|nr:hypothetical protein [Clostridia bacterium]
MIHFTNSDWDRVANSYERWWNKTSDTAIVGCMVKKYAPSEKTPAKPLLSQRNVHLGFTADEILDTIEYELSQYEFIGDAFPMFNMDCFGPGVVAAFLGCETDNNNGTTGVWFHPKEKADITEFDPVYDGDNPVFKRIKEIFKRSVERFDGKILLSMPDLGGVADVLSSFFPGEELMFEMYDNPEYVLSATEKIDVLWQRYYDELAKDLNSAAYGYTDWSRIFSKKRSYVIQSDITYMLSQEMFREFMFGSIKKHTENLERTIYHLDGVGELKNLDDILSIKGLDAVQWIPGSNGGRNSYYEWMEVYEKILAADKLVQVAWAAYEDLENIVKHVKKKGYIEQSMSVFEEKDRDYAIRSIERIKSL